MTGANLAALICADAKRNAGANSSLMTLAQIQRAQQEAGR